MLLLPQEGRQTPESACIPNRTHTRARLLTQVPANLGGDAYLPDIAKATEDIAVQVRGSSSSSSLGSLLCTVCCLCYLSHTGGPWPCSHEQGRDGCTPFTHSPGCCLTPGSVPNCAQIVFCNAGYLLTGFFHGRSADCLNGSRQGQKRSTDSQGRPTHTSMGTGA